MTTDELLLVVKTNTAEATAGLAAVEGQVSKLGQNIGSKMSKAGSTLTKGLTLPIVGAGVAAAKAAIDWESAFTGVVKTLDVSGLSAEQTAAEYERLSEGLRDMAKEIPLAATELAAIAEAAGQLGIKRDNILSFTETMAQLGVTTNLSSEEAASSLAKFANVMQMPQEEFDKLGSVIVALGNNMATTEADIVAMGQRIAGAGAVVGMTEAEVMGFAAALSSVGINAEAGGSAISKVFIEMANAVSSGSDYLVGFAEVAGMSSRDFAAAFEEDAAGAMVKFVEGLGKVKEEGGNVFAVLEDLGFTEIRTRQALLAASGAGDLLAESLGIASDAWEENTALADEAALRFGTTESQMQLLKNAIVDVGIQLGEVLVPHIQTAVTWIGENLIPWIERGIDAFKALPEPMQGVIAGAVGLVAGLGPLLKIGGSLVSMLFSVNPVFLAIAAAIGAVIFIAQELGVTWEDVMAWAQVLVDWLMGIFDGFRAWIEDHWAELRLLWTIGITYIRSIWEDIWAWLQPFIQDFVQFIEDLVGGLIDWFNQNWPMIRETVYRVMKAVKAFWDAVWPAIQKTLETVWNIIKTVVTSAINVVKGVIQTVLALISGNWSAAWDGIKQVLSSVWDLIKGVVENGINLIKNIIEVALGTLKGAWEVAWQFIGNVVKGVWDGIKSGVTTAVDSVLKTLGRMVNGAIDVINSLIRTINKVPGINISEIDHVNLGLADGGTVGGRGGGWFKVGERGPEDVFLPEGATVVPAHRSGGGMNITIYESSNALATAREVAWQVMKRGRV